MTFIHANVRKPIQPGIAAHVQRKATTTDLEIHKSICLKHTKKHKGSSQESQTIERVLRIENSIRNPIPPDNIFSQIAASVVLASKSRF